MESPDTKRQRTTAEVAAEHLRAEVEVIRQFRHAGSGFVELKIDRAVARNVLREELGEFGQYNLDHHIDDKKRDILLVNGRRDTALAAQAAVSIHEVVLGLRNLIWTVIVLLIGLIVMVAPMAMKYWPL
ncbi:MAG: hypothetical protein JNK01_20895 [Devosia sp.]|nr:hypothetical protein [Devosia sp.]